MEEGSACFRVNNVSELHNSGYNCSTVEFQLFDVNTCFLPMIPARPVCNSILSCHLSFLPKAYAIATAGQQPQRFRGLAKIGIESASGIPLSSWGRQMQQLIAIRDQKYEQDFLSTQQAKNRKKRKGKEKAARALPVQALPAPYTSPEGAQVMRFDTQYESVVGGEEDAAAAAAAAGRSSPGQEPTHSFFITADNGSELDGVADSGEGGGKVGSADERAARVSGAVPQWSLAPAGTVDHAGDGDANNNAYECGHNVAYGNLAELAPHAALVLPRSPFLPVDTNREDGEDEVGGDNDDGDNRNNGVDALDATAVEVANARATLDAASAAIATGSTTATLAVGGMEDGRVSPLQAMTPEEREDYMRRLRLRRSKTISPTKMVTADSISTGLQRWGSDRQHAPEPLEQVELHGFQIKKPLPPRPENIANNAFMAMLQGVQDANEHPQSYGRSIVSADSAWREHHERKGHKLITIEKLPGQPLGFQFVSDVRALGAVVTYVTPGGRSFGLLNPGDRILEIDHHEVASVPHNTILRLLTQPNPVLQLVIEPLPSNKKPPLLPPI